MSVKENCRTEIPVYRWVIVSGISLVDESQEEEAEDEAPPSALVEGVKVAYTKAKVQRKVS